MSYINPVEQRLDIIERTVQSEAGWSILVQFATDMKNTFNLANYGDNITIRTWPLDMMGRGSISFKIDFMPDNVYMKLWNDGGYYIAFFKLEDGYFEHIIRNTFNEDGIVPIKDLDDAEEKILDYLTMEIYKWRNHKTI